ncbi:MAG: hypothetical protein Q8Q63_08595 [Phaeovulum sp.]|uniref:hypothetical protein n=1 Tax=Phaeovulum sp. TaxID=2934796 RepID=UPI00273364A1|nr:hypothetical protein [Phaeovulum sp.]MDP3861628.1 hypothetical protein [Phaeovulum sp.]
MWAVLAVEFVLALWEQQWPLAGIAVATFVMTLAPLVLVSRLGVRLPWSFVVSITAFIFATIYLGEAADFYLRFWWWDGMLHLGSALGFGILGFLLVFMLFQGDRYAAPAWALAFIAFSFAVTIGALWEIFEFAVDSAFGLSMQETGLADTMGDLVVDVIGASAGAAAGWLYLHGRSLGGSAALMQAFIDRNRQLFRKFRK